MWACGKGDLGISGEAHLGISGKGDLGISGEAHLGISGERFFAVGCLFRSLGGLIWEIPPL